ncbi:UDP-forming cellulose synthase catalytic subunit [Acetobacter orientalis]|uniref:UDP-forming cellulose synthase catalytic subunit n=1 Tax=Acetobacter orientalis TaxID=146474 RepID=UPI0039E7DDD0
MISFKNNVSHFYPYLLIVVGVFFIILTSQAVISPISQIYLSIGFILATLFIRNKTGPAARLLMIGLSTFVSLRYIFWRLFYTLSFENPIQTFLMLTLLAAEIYSWIILFLGYLQLSWPLNRKEYPLPDNHDQWPSVDVFIPTYNEDLEVVRSTVLAAKALDYPENKLTVYLLDDGRRNSFQEFAQEAGVEYLTRPNNFHAKAGNLNHALSQSSGDLIAVFDCDHIPVKSFLVRTIGWLHKNPRISLLQTPQHFYSPDPFQRNLDTHERIPPENNLFYGLVQPGNDFWNATLFCGSCAVLRRKALESIGGFAVETVTEDAHTSLKMQRKGWESAYLRMTLAGGLATENLALHIGQRMRWARGMVQIFRVDNPLLGRGLTLGQRLCYLSAILHFFFPVPRLVFLIAPLSFLFFGQNIIYTTPLAVMTYAIPHLIQSFMTQSRVQGRWRYSIWNYVYETAIAIFLAPVVLKTLFFPEGGSFNVTAKGGLITHNYLDTKIITPNMIVVVLLVLASIAGCVGMIVNHGNSDLAQTYMMNLLWVLANLLVVMAAVSVGYERRQIRRTPRISARLPVTVVDPVNHQRFEAVTVDLSKGGLSLQVSGNLPDELKEIVVEYQNSEDKIFSSIPAVIVNRHGHIVRLSWQARSIQEECDIIEMIFGRSDTWLHWGNYSSDKPLHSLLLLARSIVNFIRIVVLRQHIG